MVVDRAMNVTDNCDLGDVVISGVVTIGPGKTVQKVPLLYFHRRFGHLNFNTIERLASSPHSRIEFTDHAQEQCLACAQGKQTRASQSKQGTGLSAATDHVVGVISSDFKVMITPRDRRRNRYLVDFVDHKNNYCRIFLAKAEDQATKELEDFLICRVNVLRSDEGGEYKKG